jgi:chemotaxis protein CheD
MLDSPQLYFIHPGDIAIGYADDKFETLLGSCVSILLVSPCCKVAAICHYVHSSAPPRSKTKDASYAAVAMRKMDYQFRSVGFNTRLCRAYVFGGGNMFPSQKNMVDVGTMNVNWAFSYLDRHKIPVKGSHTGDNYYRKLAWIVGTSDPCQAVQAISVNSS